MIFTPTSTSQTILYCFNKYCDKNNDEFCTNIFINTKKQQKICNKNLIFNIYYTLFQLNKIICKTYT